MLHADKSFPNRIKSNRNQILFTIFRLIPNGRSFGSIWFRFDLIRFGKDFSACARKLLANIVFLNQIKFVFYLHFSGRFFIERNCVWCKINRKSVITIQIWFDITRIRIDFSVCTLRESDYCFFFKFKIIQTYWQFPFDYKLNRIPFGS